MNVHEVEDIQRRDPFPRLAREVAIGAMLLALYVLAGKLGLALAYEHASVSPVWPPTGIAIGAFLVFGTRVWPAIFVGAFVVNVTTAGTVATSTGIAIGNTLEGLVAARLVVRFAGGTQAFFRPSYVFSFALLAGVLSTTLSATIGVTSLALGGFLPWSSFDSIWLTWWLGDLAGALIVTPAFVLCAVEPRGSWTGRQVLEAVLLVLTLLCVAEIVFGGLWRTSSGVSPLQFLCIPPLLWAAFRFGPRATAVAGILLSGMATLGTLGGSGPFANGSQNESLLFLQSFVAATTFMSLAVAAGIRGIREADAHVVQLNAGLERLVEDRTRALEASNHELSVEVAKGRRAEEQLKQGEARLIEAQRIAHVGSWEWDIVQNHVWWSDELFRIYDLDPTGPPLSYQDFLECVHPDDRERTDRIVFTAMEDHQPFAYEHRIVVSDGTVRTISARGQVLLDANGVPRAMVGTGQDITERKLAEAEREALAREQAARREAEDANRLKDEFLAVLSHELRTPLNAMLGWAVLLRDGKLDPATQAKAIETIVRNAQVQSHLISDILDVSRILSGQVTLRARTVDLGPLVEAAVATLAPDAEARRVAVHVAMEPKARPILGDPARLQQILWNLLSNAIKFAPANGSGRVDVRVRVSENAAEITVRDNGPGIRPEFLPHVFDRFRQADASTTRNHGGLGLGLAIVRHLVELHGGSVKAENNAGGTGALFTVMLPLSSTDPRALDSDGSTPEGLENAHIETVSILVVDDERDARELLAAILGRWGSRVRAADSVEEALRMVDTEVPDLILADIGMPVADGYALLRRLRALPDARGGKVPVAAVTAYASAEDRRKALDAGFNAHLAKPVDATELMSVVVHLLRFRDAAQRS